MVKDTDILAAFVRVGKSIN